MITYNNETKKVTIKQKMSNSGTIHDIASDQYDININMQGFGFFVLAPSFYNIGATRHKFLHTASKRVDKLTAMGYEGVLWFMLLEDKVSELPT